MSDEADDIFVCSTCGAAPDENGLCHGLCGCCFPQQDTEDARVDWSVMEEHDVNMMCHALLLVVFRMHPWGIQTAISILIWSSVQYLA